MGSYRSADATVSAHGAVVVVPSDSTIIPTCRGIYVGVSGNITVRMADAINGGGNGPNDNITFANVPVGFAPIQADKIYATGTTATSLLVLY